MHLRWLDKGRREYLKKQMKNFLLRVFWLRWKWISRRTVLWLAKMIPDRELKTHCYITGKTWSGKSSLVEQLIYALWWKSRKTEDRTIVVLDPHGDTVQRIRKFDLAKKYFKRHIYIDPVLAKWHTPVLNPLECHSKDSLDIEIQANQLLRAIQEMIPDAKLSNFMRAILKPCLYVLLSKQDTNLTDLQEMLTQEEGRRVDLGKQCEVLAYAQFFATERNDPMYLRTKQSLYTKLQSLLNSQIFYHMTLWPSTIQLPRALQQGKILLFNLSKGRMGEEVTETLGRLLIAQIKSFALQRAGIPAHIRKPIYLIIDEADTFISWDSLNVILKETRKYGLHLILISQNIVSGVGHMKLRRNLLNNTNVKVIWANWLSTLKALANETGIKLKTLQFLWFHQFRIRYGAYYRKLIKTKDTLWRKSPLLLRKGQVTKQTHKMVYETGYYRPRLTRTSSPDRIRDMPQNRQDKLARQHYPSPKFSTSSRWRNHIQFDEITF